MSVRWHRIITAVVAGASVVASIALTAPSAQAAKKPIVVWADQALVSALQASFPEGYGKRPLVVVPKAPDAMLADLAAVTEADAPDVIQIEHTSVGSLAATTSIVPISVDPKIAKRFSTSVWSGFSPNGISYGVPVTMQNVALLTNAALVPTQPTTFDALSKAALALKKDHKVKLPFAIGQAPTGDADAMYPLFSALGGYIFATDAAGSVNVADMGIANPAFLANTPKIDEWNAAKLIRSGINPDRARAAFVAGRAPFWIARESDLSTIMALSFAYRITAVPQVIAGKDAAPLLYMSGFAQTNWASQHGVAEEVASFLADGLTGKKVQGTLAAALKQAPASIAAQAAMATTGESARLRAFATAGAKGVAAPSVPAHAAVLATVGNAWLISTSGPEATTAKKAFKQAQAAATVAMAG